MNTILAFDIETVPDVQGIRTLYDLPSSLPDDEVVLFAQQKRRAQTGGDFMQHHLHQVVAVSCCMRWGQDKVHVGTIGEMDDGEEVVIAKFFELVEKHTPQLVSWNGGGFDLPVLHYRSLIYGINAARYWDTGDGDFGDSRDFKWNNYISRYHQRHCDLMDLLALYQPRANVPLDDMAKLCGFPGKLGMDGSKVWEAFHTGRLKEIRNYCETDAANTYLMYLRFCLVSGRLDADEYEMEIKRMRNYLSAQVGEKPHWEEFVRAWE
ncbi:3'-5' exonuclease [Neisseria gonorrhoeae]|uniref:3'-5' exonuclease n=1 Tax=Neisseria gonorrhoeae TaxID=485 RepID=UPI000CD19E8E|nr:3'-5' exonuclease [Neisseria gonorrhoeae]MCU9894958.1 3'-5' exonuclease [Neisseria gonorrhoeae]QDM62159.1 3'-5' exonuclease [Neisseria gonorrhoeae]QDM62861.1 3'-5' exonuclease [Neisseria gonorrhoeae]QNV01756.1 3'-5' exonuclease [Neisseria gonorrhoeae]WLF07893.1 3'-5' exonuclease [Neisseria gonorrhoeae]